MRAGRPSEPRPGASPDRRRISWCGTADDHLGLTLSARSGEADSEEPMRAVEALELDFAAVDEVDARACDEIVHEAGHEHLTCKRLARDPGRIVNRRAEELV